MLEARSWRLFDPAHQAPSAPVAESELTPKALAAYLHVLPKAVATNLGLRRRVAQ